MSIAWYLGFGWITITIVVLCGVGIQLIGGMIGAVLYVPFLGAALYMTVRFRLFSRQPWRRVHGRAMQLYGAMAAREYEYAKKEQRTFDLQAACRALAAGLFKEYPESVAQLFDDKERVGYYLGLATEYSEVFFEGVAAERRDSVLMSVRQDIESSRPGPDVLIAKMIELKHSRRDAALYLRELMLGRMG